MRLASRFGRINSIRKDRPLTNEELMHVVPSVFSEDKHDSRSERYTYIPTIALLDALREEGFQPFYACQTRVRDESKRGHTKHMLRLRREDMIVSGNKEVPEIVLLNSHDGSSSYQMMPGMFRYACANGMVFGQSFGDIRVPHKGDITGQVIDGAYDVLGIFDRVDSDLDTMKSISLTGRDQELFARAALSYRYEYEEKSPVTPAQVLQPRRSEDNSPDLWTTFQRVQENMIKGGLPGRYSRGKNTRTRAVKGIDGDIRLNRALWLIADEFKNRMK